MNIYRRFIKSNSVNPYNLSNSIENNQAGLNESSIKSNITHLENNFNFLELKDAIEMNIQKIVEQYEGEHHFVFFDNIATFQNYTTNREIKKFITEFINDLQKLNLYGFFMIPKGSLKLTLLDTIQSIPSLISNKLSFWNK